MFPWSFLSVRHRGKRMRRCLLQNGLQGVFNWWLWVFHFWNPEIPTKPPQIKRLLFHLGRNDPSILAPRHQCVKVEAAAWSRVAGSTINLPVRLLSRGSQRPRLRLLFTLRRTSEFLNKVSREDAAQVRQQPWLKYSSCKIGQKQAC